MTGSITAAPLRYDPTMEQPEKNEAEVSAQLNETLKGIGETTFKDGGHGIRTVHAKSHALLKGKLEVLPNLPAHLAQGLFATPGTHDIVMRLSSNAGDILDDSVTLPRGLALKVLNVEGPRVEGSEGDTTQDFVMVNGPAFAAPNAGKFLSTLKPLAATTDINQNIKKAVSAVLRGTEHVIEAFGGESGTLKSMGGHPMTHPLGETFYTQTPFLYGEYVAKFSVAPVAPDLQALTDAPLDVTGKPHGLRDAIVDFFHAGGGAWDLRVQLLNNPDTMPVEDASVAWPEDESPFVTVGRITVPPQEAWTDARSEAVDDRMSFSPWHALAAHRPLGSVNRTRKSAYKMSSDMRAGQNRCPIHEPAAMAEVGG